MTEAVLLLDQSLRTGIERVPSSRQPKPRSANRATAPRSPPLRSTTKATDDDRPHRSTQRRTAPSGLLLKAAVVIPEVIISSLIWLVIIPAPPPATGLGLTLVGLTAAAVLAAGLAEGTTVRLLTGPAAPPPTMARLAVAWRIATHGLDADDVRLRIVTYDPPVGTAGCRHVLLRRDVVDAYCATA